MASRTGGGSGLVESWVWCHKETPQRTVGTGGSPKGSIGCAQLGWCMFAGPLVKRLHRCLNGCLWHQLARTNFTYVRACRVFAKALNDEIYVRHGCKLLVDVFFILGYWVCAKEACPCARNHLFRHEKQELVHFTLLHAVCSESFLDEVRGDSRDSCLFHSDHNACWKHWGSARRPFAFERKRSSASMKHVMKPTILLM